MKYDFSGFPKIDFRRRMINQWMREGCFKTEGEAIDNYGTHDFDTLCERCDGATLLHFKYDIGTGGKECFEIVDNNFVIPISAINVYNLP